MDYYKKYVTYNLAFIVLNTVVGIIFAILSAIRLIKIKENLSECNLVSIWCRLLFLATLYMHFKSEYRYCKQFDFKCTWKRCCELVCRTEILAVHSDFCKYLEGVGYGCLIYISTINGIDPSLYEAASGWRNQMAADQNTTLPFLKPTNHPDIDVGHLLFRFRSVLSGTTWFRTSVLGNQCYWYLRILRPDEIRRNGMSAAAGFISPSSDLSLSLPQTESYVKSAKKTYVLRITRKKPFSKYQILATLSYLDACHYLTVYSVIYVFYYRWKHTGSEWILLLSEEVLPRVSIPTSSNPEVRFEAPMEK